jgi:iron complex transport system substrate-binding protein
VVATDISATYPVDAASLPKVGYQRTLSAEGILSFRPTVVIGNTDAGPPAVIEQLRAAGVPVVIQHVDPTIDAPAAKIRATASALGVPGRGDALATTTQSQIDAAATRAKSSKESPRSVFLYLRGASTQIIMGRGTTASVMLDAAHTTDAAVEAGINGTAPITAESLVAAAPDVIVVTTTGLESVGGIDGLLAIPGIAQTPAGQARRVFAYEDQAFLGGGPRTGQALTQFVDDVHPGVRASEDR